MLKFFGLLGWVGISLLIIQAAALASEDQDSSVPTAPGICYLPFRSGRMVVGPTGQLMRLSDFCNQTQTEPSVAPATEQVYTQTESSFWQSFVTAASPTALEFAEALGEDKVIEYGASICATLRNGQSLDHLRQAQSDGRTSVAFEAAVTVAAVITDCPEFRSQLGRFSAGTATSRPAAP